MWTMHTYDCLHGWLFHGWLSPRLERWSIFDSDAMPMFFFSQQRCDVDGFGHFLTSQSVRLFLVNYRDWLNLKDQCLAMIFCGKPKDNVFYDMLKVTTNCAYISALGVKGEQFTINEHKLWINNEFLQNLWLDCFSYALGSNKGRQITTIVKELWFSMS